MEDKEPPTINVDLTPKDVHLFMFLLENTITLMTLTGCSQETYLKFKENMRPLCDKIIEKAQKEITRETIGDLKLTFTDKNSPKDKSNG